MADGVLVARELVRRVISGSLQRLARERERQTVAWPTGEEFTVERGQQAIADTVKEWELSDSWKYCIDYLGVKERGQGEAGGAGLHCYRVQWSEPTRLQPVPMATASVYFFLTHPEQQQQQQQQGTVQETVQAFYVVEGQRLVHRPGRDKFQEVWLRNVIQHKLSITQTCPQ